MRRAERAHAAAARRELLHVRQLPLVHPFLHEARVHAVEPEDDELLLEFLGRPPRPARRRNAETDNERGEKGAFHKSLERRNYTIWTWDEFSPSMWAHGASGWRSATPRARSRGRWKR